MSSVPSSAVQLSDQEHASQLRRAVVASTVGTAIEWYDFFLYSSVTGLVFAKLFFPRSEQLVGTLQAFTIYFVGFLARPLGAVNFGHFGDRVGRKSTLIVTLVTMGVATFLVGLVPTYDLIGVWGAIILTLLRFIQGIGVGGEWGGSVVLSMEWARTNKHRGFVTSWPQAGVPFGLFLANLAVLFFSKVSGESFLSWGWRIPFLLSIALIGVGLYIRLGIAETPAFKALVTKKRIATQPVLEVIRKHPKSILLAALARTGEQAPFYVFTAFVFTYGTTALGMPRDFLLTALLVAASLSCFTTPFFGFVSDRIGRKRMYMTGAALTGVFGFAYFGILGTGSHLAIFLLIALSLIPHDMMYGPQAALIAETFTGRLRYSGASLGYQLASILAGGPAPLIATALLASYHTGYAIAAYVAVCAVISLIATSFMTDRTNRGIEEHDYGVTTA